jgi:hypothetical protein
VLLLALMASSSTDNAEVTVAKLLTGLGWAVGDGQPIDRPTVTGLIATDVHLLHHVGAFEEDRGGGWPGTVTPDGIALAGLHSPHRRAEERVRTRIGWSPHRVRRGSGRWPALGTVKDA